MQTLIIRLPSMACAILLLTACASKPAAWNQRAPLPTSAHASHSPVKQQHSRTMVVRVAENMIGTPYRYGGNSPRGFDCSGLVQFSYAHAGISVPRNTQQQFNYASPASIKHLQRGDLLFFKLNRRKASHVGIYIGQGEFIHAPSSGKRVSSASLSNPYWRERIAGAGHYF